jgi:hypothetical protein
MRTCPKCQHTQQDSGASTCPACGLVFAKYEQYLQQRRDGPALRHTVQDDSENWRETVMERLLGEPEPIERQQLLAYAFIWLVLLLWGGYFVFSGWRSNVVGASFLHGVNLAFHEFGHILFRPFGEWMMFLGGSLFQCMVPLIFGGVFLLRQHQRFAAAVCLWWCGQNMLDVSPYIGDARALDLSLVGEYSEEIADQRALRHDWHNILDRIGLLAWDERLATLCHLLGSLVMLVALGWAAWSWWQSWQAEADS